jgi:hypothetical protein
MWIKRQLKNFLQPTRLYSILFGIVAFFVLAPIVWKSLFSWFYSPIALLMPVFLALLIFVLILLGIDAIFKTRLKRYGFITVGLFPVLFILSIPASNIMYDKSQSYAEWMLRDIENYAQLNSEYPTDEYIRDHYREKSYMGTTYRFERRFDNGQQYSCIEFASFAGTTCTLCSDDYVWGGHD